MVTILGISAFYHDSAAALIVDGEVVAAAQEERFTHKKHDSEFPVHAIEYCLSEAGVRVESLDYVGFYDKPFVKFERLIESYLACAPHGFKSFREAMPLWLKKKLYLPREIRNGLNGNFEKRLVFTAHHESHAASAFFPSPFDEAAVLTMDGVGEWATASYGVGKGNKIDLHCEMHFPHSLGLLYSAFTYYCGFTVNSGEYKLMGLAPYGEPRYYQLILDTLIDLKQDGSFRMDMTYFNYCAGLTMTSPKFDQLFGGPPRKENAPLTQRDMDIAASIQKVTEEIMLRSVRHLHAETGQKNLCLAGGVALNCVANGRIMREGPFERIWVQPAAGDAGGALGTALFVWHQLLDKPRKAKASDSMKGALLGPAYSDEQIQRFLDTTGVSYTRWEDEDKMLHHLAALLEEGKVVGWFQGRMEFGPRALGSRSILGDPRNPVMQALMNVKVKFREGFRPFAPSVLREHAGEYFTCPDGTDNPYMLVVHPVKDETRRSLTEEERAATGIERLKVVRSTITSVTHVDYTARIQTVDEPRHGKYRRLIEAFHHTTNCPVVVNTSFNLGWDPIVNEPRDAFRTFMSCDMDALCMGSFVITKEAQNSSVRVGDDLADNDDEVLAPLLRSPCADGDLIRRQDKYICAATGREFPISDGIPQLFWPHESFGQGDDVTDAVKAFYEECPFPNYDEHDSVRSLIEKSRAGVYARQLDEAIPYNSTILEVGCGTGQLTNYLGISCRRVIGTDLCMNSLRLAEEFRRRHALNRVRFVQMNLFRPVFGHGQFDVVLCNGVLHHTADPFGGFAGLVPLVKPGGYIVIGLYNRYGRLLTDLRRTIFKYTGGYGKWLDPQFRRLVGREKRRAWFADQYRHPHESKHTTDEILGWFEKCKIDFVRGVPSVCKFGGDGNDSLFSPTSEGSKTGRFLLQLAQIHSGNLEGGFFVMIGRRPSQVSDETDREQHVSSIVEY
jgi:carbamoyltransferase